MSLNTILGIMWAVMGAFAVGVIGYILWYRFIRPKKVALKAKPTDHSGIPRKDVTEFIPLKDISNGWMTFDGQYRFVRSMKTTGQDLFLATEDEQKRTEAAFQQFFRIIQGPITFRIDSTACDLSVTIEDHQIALQRTENEYGEAVTQFAMLEQQFQNAATDQEKHDILYEMYKVDKHVTAYENAIAHLKQQIEFLEAHNGGERNPIIEQRYFYEWSYNPDDYPKNEDLIINQAKNELAATEKVMADALLSAGVKCKVDDEDTLFDLNYRHYHPYAGMIYRDHNATDYEEKLNRGRAYYDINTKKYHAIKQEDIIIKEFAKIEEEEKKAAEAVVEEPLTENDDVHINATPDTTAYTEGEGGIDL